MCSWNGVQKACKDLYVVIVPEAKEEFLKVPAE